MGENAVSVDVLGQQQLDQGLINQIAVQISDQVNQVLAQQINIEIIKEIIASSLKPQTSAMDIIKTIIKNLMEDVKIDRTTAIKIVVEQLRYIVQLNPKLNESYIIEGIYNGIFEDRNFVFGRSCNKYFGFFKNDKFEEGIIICENGGIEKMIICDDSSKCIIKYDKDNNIIGASGDKARQYAISEIAERIANGIGKPYDVETIKKVLTSSLEQQFIDARGIINTIIEGLEKAIKVDRTTAIKIVTEQLSSIVWLNPELSESYNSIKSYNSIIDDYFFYKGIFEENDFVFGRRVYPSGDYCEGFFDYYSVITDGIFISDRSVEDEFNGIIYNITTNKDRSKAIVFQIFNQQLEKSGLENLKDLKAVINSEGMLTFYIDENGIEKKLSEIDQEKLEKVSKIVKDYFDSIPREKSDGFDSYLSLILAIDPKILKNNDVILYYNKSETSFEAKWREFEEFVKKNKNQYKLIVNFTTVDAGSSEDVPHGNGIICYYDGNKIHVLFCDSASIICSVEKYRKIFLKAFTSKKSFLRRVFEKTFLKEIAILGLNMQSVGNCNIASVELTMQVCVNFFLPCMQAGMSFEDTLALFKQCIRIKEKERELELVRIQFGLKQKIKTLKKEIETLKDLKKELEIPMAMLNKIITNLKEQKFIYFNENYDIKVENIDTNGNEVNDQKSVKSATKKYKSMKDSHEFDFQPLQISKQQPRTLLATQVDDKGTPHQTLSIPCKDTQPSQTSVTTSLSTLDEDIISEYESKISETKQKDITKAEQELSKGNVPQLVPSYH